MDLFRALGVDATDAAARRARSTGASSTLLEARHRARRGAAGPAAAARARSRRGADRSAARPSSAPTASSRRAGLVRGYVGRGTFVSATPDAASAPFAWRGKIAASALQADRYDGARSGARRGRSAPDFGGRRRAGARLFSDRRRFSARMNRVLATQADAAWRHGPTEGLQRFRAALGAALRRRARAHPGARRRAAGARSAGALPDRSRRRRRSSIVPATSARFRRSATPARGWSDGTSRRADIDELEELLLRYRPKLIYTNPTHQNPTGVTLPIRDAARDARAGRALPRADRRGRHLSRSRADRTAAAAVAVRPRRGAHRRHPHQQLLEDAGARAASRLDQRGAADRRSAGADQAAGRSAHRRTCRSW